MSLINCEIKLNLSWSKECIISGISIIPRVPGDALINNKPFFDQPVKNRQEAYEKQLKIITMLYCYTKSTIIKAIKMIVINSKMKKKERKLIKSY